MIRELLLRIGILEMLDSILSSCSLNLRNTLEFFYTYYSECKKALGWLTDSHGITWRFFGMGHLLQ